MQVLFYVLMFAVGAGCGSFLCCQARRMRRKELGQPSLGKWSVCTSCGRRLRWWENIPIISWLMLRGRCKRCGARIGRLEIVAELVTVVMMVMISSTIEVETASAWEWGKFAVAVVFAMILMFLAIYDGMWGELPNLVLTFATICATIGVILEQWRLFSAGQWTWGSLLSVIGAVGVLGGVYLMLYVVSRGRWVGDGDWWLAAAIGAMLGTPWLALLGLFLANFLACVVMGPAVLRRKNPKIYFGPFLVAAWVVVYTFSGFLGNLV